LLAIKATGLIHFGFPYFLCQPWISLRPMSRRRKSKNYIRDQGNFRWHGLVARQKEQEPQSSSARFICYCAPASASAPIATPSSASAPAPAPVFSCRPIPNAIT